MTNRDDEVRQAHIEDTAPLLAGMVTGEWLDRQKFPELQHAVPGLMPEGFGLLVGPPKAGKSWLVADVGLAVAAGGKALGAIPVTAKPVLYLALEDGHRRLQTRFRRLMADQPIPAGMHVIITARPHQVIGMVAEFLHLYAERQPLVILDTLGKAKPPKAPGEDSYATDYSFGTRLKDTIDATPGSTLLVVHHTRKAESADFVDAVSGTHGIAGSADFVIVLARKRHQREAILSVTGRDITENEYAIVTDNGLWSLDGADLAEAARNAETRRDEHQLGDRALEVLSMVNRNSGTRAADVEELGIPAQQARVYLKRLADSGRIKKIGRGLYSSLDPQPTAEGVDDHERTSRRRDASTLLATHPALDPQPTDPAVGVCYVPSVTSDESPTPTQDVTNETKQTPRHPCGCGQPLQTLAEMRSGRCKECRADV